MSATCKASGLLVLATSAGRPEMLYGVAKRVLAGDNLTPQHQAELLVFLAEYMLLPEKSKTSQAALRRQAKAKHLVSTGKLR